VSDTAFWCECGKPAAIFVQTLANADGQRPYQSPSFAACEEHAMKAIAHVTSTANVSKVQVRVLA
jgi:hypothetical protein